MDEYQARNTCRKIIHAFGDIRPFSNIAEAEQRHIDFLLQLYAKYSTPVPQEPDISEHYSVAKGSCGAEQR